MPRPPARHLPCHTLLPAQIDSFDTTAPQKAKGTVFGEQCTCYTQCTCPGCPTCYASCNGTCDASCNGTCGATCDASCYGSCDYSCNCTYEASCNGQTCPTAQGPRELCRYDCEVW
jgi:hypothetical protein